jgi:hypothetical protein
MVGVVKQHFVQASPIEDFATFSTPLEALFPRVEAVRIGRVSSYKLKTVLPRGVVFPFDFGSIPGTVADHGDPLGLLLLTATITLVRQ